MEVWRVSFHHDSWCIDVDGGRDVAKENGAIIASTEILDTESFNVLTVIAVQNSTEITIKSLDLRHNNYTSTYLILFFRGSRVRNVVVLGNSAPFL